MVTSVGEGRSSGATSDPSLYAASALEAAARGKPFFSLSYSKPSVTLDPTLNTFVTSRTEFYYVPKVNSY